MRGSSLEALRRAGLNLARGTVHASSDKSKLQTIDFRGYDNELIPGVENFGMPYGFSSVPLPPNKQTKAGEVVVAFLGGNRSHPIIIGYNDRRYRPTGWNPGESGLHDHQGQMVHVANGGIQVTGGPKKLPLTITVGSSTVTIADGTITLKGDKIVLDGMVYLGGSDADKPAAMLGSIDSHGDTEQSNLATKVMVK